MTMTHRSNNATRVVRILIAAFTLAVSITPTFAEYDMATTETYTHEMCDGVPNPEAKKCITVRIEIYSYPGHDQMLVDSGKLWLNESVCNAINQNEKVHQIYQSDTERGIFRMPSRKVKFNTVYPYEWKVPVDCEYQYTINWKYEGDWFGTKKELRIAPIQSSSDICIRRALDKGSNEACSQSLPCASCR